MRAIILAFVLTVASAFSLPAQSPMPIVVPAMTPATTTTMTTARVPATAAADAPAQAAMAALQELKAANEEILRQQAATLLKLEEMEKTANEIRIYSKRG